MIGDFLKELNLAEGKATGFPIIWAEMAKNGSSVPVFSSRQLEIESNPNSGVTIVFTGYQIVEGNI